MPELPEVETMRRDLHQQVGAAYIEAVEIIAPRSVVGDAEAFRNGVCGRQIIGCERRGKVLQILLDNGARLLAHPRMTGGFAFIKGDAPWPRHTRVAFTVNTADGPLAMLWVDSRRFGRLELAAAGSRPEQAETLANIGCDALTCGPEMLLAALRRRPGSTIKNLLMDQRVVSGIGNIYASEILHRCGLDPRTRCARLGPRAAEILSKAIVEVLHEGIAHRGTTISTYRSADGAEGGYQRHLRVYGRTDSPCLVPGCGGTVRRFVIGGRSTYACDRCQKKRVRTGI